MQVTVGQRVSVPHPSGDGRILATVVAIGEQSDAKEVEIAGMMIPRDVAIVRYDESDLDGTTDKVPYHLITDPSDGGA